MPDPERTQTAPEILETLERLSPEERADLEHAVMLWHARTGTEIVEMVTRHGETFPIFSEVLEVPRLPGDEGPRNIRVRFPEDGAPDDDEDL